MRNKFKLLIFLIILLGVIAGSYAQVLIWSYTSNPTTTYDYVRGAAVDSASNIIIAYSSVSDYKMSVEKISPSGSKAWSYKSSSLVSDSGYDGVVVDSADNIIIAGSLSLTPKIMAEKISPSGSKIWSYTSSALNSFGIGIAVDSQGNIIIAGVDASQSDRRIRVEKISSSGNLVWSYTSNPSTQEDRAYAVAVDSSDNIIIAGYDYGMPLTGYRQIRVEKISSSGSNVWSYTSNPSPSHDDVYAVAVDSADNIIIAGADNNLQEIRVEKISPSGSIIWSYTSNPSSSSDSASGVVVDSAGNIIIGGGDYSKGVSNGQIRVEKISSSGSKTWEYTSNPTTGGDAAKAVMLDSSGNLIIAANTENSASIRVEKVCMSGCDLDMSCTSCVSSGKNWDLTGGSCTGAVDFNWDSSLTSSSYYCCGDDSGEYYMTGSDGTKACCNSLSDIVVGGQCLSCTNEVCNDAIDNDCDSESDYDSTDGRHGDNDCQVSVTAISVSDSNPNENTNINIDCTSSIAGVNSISAYIDSSLCTWNSWNGNIAKFSCNVGAYTGASKTAKCTVDTLKSYKSGTDKTTSINVKPSSCSTYSSSASCNADSRCNWCAQCSSTKYSGGNDGCVDAGSCSYYCWKGQCGATCDSTNGGWTNYVCDNYCSGNALYTRSDITNYCKSDCTPSTTTCSTGTSASCGATSCTAQHTTGSCNNPCNEAGTPTDNTDATCGICTPACSCESGYIDLNNNMADGCECQASIEVCDGLDNDCDGGIDEGLTGLSCPIQEGACAGSRKTCGGAAGWLDCTATTYLGNNPYYQAIEISCNDVVDNDCDGLTDVSDDNCWCLEGTTLCDTNGDGIGDSCLENCQDTPDCDQDGSCETGEGCACMDCDYEQDGCASGLVCDYNSKKCIGTAPCPEGTTLCGDGYCRENCGTDYGVDDGDTECDLGEGCNVAACDSLQDSCEIGLVCDYNAKICAGGPPCPIGTSLCADGICKSDCANNGGDSNCLEDGTSACEPGESCSCDDCDAMQDSCESGLFCDYTAGLCSDEADLSSTLCEALALGTQGVCDAHGEKYCWSPSPSIKALGRCCGDDEEETWAYSTQYGLEDILVEGTCYSGEWYERESGGITYYGIIPTE